MILESICSQSIQLICKPTEDVVVTLYVKKKLLRIL